MKSPLWLLATPCAIPVAVYALANPTAFVVIVVGLVVVASIAIGMVGGGKWVDSRRDVAERDRKIADLEAECQRLHLLLTEAQLTDAKTAAFVPVPLISPRSLRPNLRVIPPQRLGDHLADDDAWFTRLYDENGEHRG